ncbi:hypothetical protein BGZ74_008887 [Mortierella antarctica]|nr:hypothetical protein BGZ74_008887 [Mortierella antarctica]
MLNYTGAINHIGLSSSNLAKSKNFYSFLLVDLMGYQIGMDEPSCLMFGRKTGEGKIICISPGNTTTPHHKTNPGLHHLAFSAGTHEEIDELHKKIVSFYESHPGFGHILNAPALYPDYGPHYYAVFFTDPDGIKLELTFSEGQ